MAFFSLVLYIGPLGVGDVELLILYELWAGERMVLEKAHPRYLRPGRPISVSAVPFGPGIDIWRSCRFIGAMVRSLCLLPGGLGRFVPCSIGANHCRLRHTEWEKCGHGLPGLVSRPRRFFFFLMNCWYYLGILLVLLLPCWVGSCSFGTALVNLLVGFLLGVFLLVVMFGVLLLSLLVLRRCRGVVVGEFLGDIFLKVRLHRKTPAHLAGFGGDRSSQSRPRRVEGSEFRHNVAKVPRLLRGVEAHGSLDMVGVE